MVMAGTGRNDMKFGVGLVREGIKHNIYHNLWLFLYIPSIFTDQRSDSCLLSPALRASHAVPPCEITGFVIQRGHCGQ